MTFSIVARDPVTGDLGIAVASKFLAVGAVVPHARAGVGAIATQALANVRYGPEGLALLADGLGAADALARLTAADEGRDHRQAGIVDAGGGSASHTGTGCIPWAGGRTAAGVAAQGNLLAGPNVVDALLETFVAGGAALPELLLRALKAGDDQGGDRRGRESAALVVVREHGGYGGGTDRWIDLRVDDHPAPIDELSRLLELNHLYLDRPDPAELLPIDDNLATELRDRLAKVGYDPRNLDPQKGLARIVEGPGVTRTGTPREAPAAWDQGYEAALAEWMSIENLEERMTAHGWIDPKVLAFLRAKAQDAGGAERPAMSPKIVFIHGAWVTPRCWDQMRGFFEGRGYECLAPAWPGKDRTVEQIRADPSPLAGLGIGEIVAHYEQIIRGLDEPPILIGHSFGGLFTQILLDRGLGAAGVAIDPAPPRGVLAFEPSAYRSLIGVLLTPLGWRKVVRWKYGNFRYAFVHTLPEADAREAYDTQVTPETGRIFFQDALAALSRHSPAKVDFANKGRPPLLIIGGSNDRIVPARLVRRTVGKYAKAGAPADYQEFPGRTHWLIAQEGWQEVAQAAAKFIEALPASSADR